MKQSERMKNLEIRNEIVAKKREATLWRWFSLYVRLRDCNAQGFGRCVTCSKPIYFKEADAGHYIAQKNHYSVVYDEMNVGLQCKNCNKYLHGNVEKYRAVLVERHGELAVENLEERSRVVTKNLALWEVEEKTGKYRQKAKDEAYRNGIKL